MKYRIEIVEKADYESGEVIFISNSIDLVELSEILPILLKPSMFGNTNVYRVSIIPPE